MTVVYPVRNAVKSVLLNDANELLLMCMDDPTIRSLGEQYGGHVWTLINGTRRAIRDRPGRTAQERENRLDDHLEAFKPELVRFDFSRACEPVVFVGGRGGLQAALGSGAYPARS